MRVAKLSAVAMLGDLLSTSMSMAMLMAGCGHAGGPDTAAAATPPGLRSQRRLTYLVAKPVNVAAPADLAAWSVLAPNLDQQLRDQVKRDMTQLGLVVEADAGGEYDLLVGLSASLQPVGRLMRARAVMGVLAGGIVIERIDSAEIIQPADRLGDALARDLVEKLAGSVPAAEYADSIYGHRLRPLRDTVGGHAAGRQDQAGGAPPLEALAYGERPRWYSRTTQGQSQLLPPARDPEAQAAAQAESTRARALLAAGHFRDAYASFERAFLIDDDVEPLFGMAEALFSAGDREPALIFYRAYLRSAPSNSPSSARANAQVGTLEPPRR